MYLKSYMVIFFASISVAQFPPFFYATYDSPTETIPESIATSPPSPDDSPFDDYPSDEIPRIIFTIPEYPTVTFPNVMSTSFPSSDNEFGPGTSQSSGSKPTDTASVNQACPAQTGVVGIGALFGIGALVANL